MSASSWAAASKLRVPILAGQLLSVSMPVFTNLGNEGTIGPPIYAKNSTRGIRDRELCVVLWVSDVMSVEGSRHVMVLGSFGVGYAWSVWCNDV